MTDILNTQIEVEKVIWGKKEGDLYESLLLTHAERYNIPEAIALMESEGWQVRVAEIDLTTPPDFAGTVNKL